MNARRIVVAGIFGAGSTTLARGIAERLGVDPREAWVTEWHNHDARPLLLARAWLAGLP